MCGAGPRKFGPHLALKGQVHRTAHPKGHSVDLRSDQPFALLKNGLGEAFPPLGKAERCDVAVIGAGISGALVADELVANGLDVVVIDKRDAGHGSTAASTALLQYEVDTPLSRLIPLVGRDHALRAYRLGVEALEHIHDAVRGLGAECGYAARPSFFVARHERDVRLVEEEYKLRREIDPKLKYLDAGAIAERFPFDGAAALYSRIGAEVDCYRLCHLLLKRAEKRGARVHDNTAVSKVVRARGGFRIQTDREFDVTSRTVVFCTGYESREFIPRENTGCLRSTYVVASEPIADFSTWPDRCLIWETGHPYYYLRTTADNRAYIGGLDDDFRSPKLRDAAVPRKAGILVRRFRSMFPDIPWETYCAWGGTFGETKDGLAYLGEAPSLPGAFFVLGYGGNGITYSAIAAQLARDFVLRRKNKDADIFRFGR